MRSFFWEIFFWTNFLAKWIIWRVYHCTGPIGGDGSANCCPIITVNADDNNQELSGKYKLKIKQESKPNEVCINGCIYTKQDDPDEYEYCFKMENIYPAVVKCEVMKSLSMLQNTKHVLCSLLESLFVWQSLKIFIKRPYWNCVNSTCY